MCIPDNEMRELIKYTPQEWFKLTPLKHMYKHARNRLVSTIYTKKKAGCMSCSMEHLIDIDFPVVAIAYEQPWAIEVLVKLWRINVSGAVLIIADNSKSDGARAEMADICRRHEVCYIGLPSNMTKHPNRSHALAMQWVFNNIIHKLDYDNFGFIDHDLFPVKKLSLEKIVDDQIVFGQEKARSRTDPGAWTVWAGYCFFNRSLLGKVMLNFMYDISRDLDTGGMNYEVVYRRISKSGYSFAEVNRTTIADENGNQLASNLQEVDGAWFHVGTIGYSKSAEERIAVAKRIAEMLLGGAKWSAMKSAK